jgi:hypothetical protein
VSSSPDLELYQRIAAAAHKDPELSLVRLGQRFGVSARTVHAALAHHRVEHQRSTERYIGPAVTSLTQAIAKVRHG